MALCRFDYDGYGSLFLTRSDLKPSTLRLFGIFASQKKIDQVYRRAYYGWILTGGKGHQCHTAVYSIERLRKELSHL